MGEGDGIQITNMKAPQKNIIWTGLLITLNPLYFLVAI